jgi:hypothetical protein
MPMNLELEPGRLARRRHSDTVNCDRPLDMGFSARYRYGRGPPFGNYGKAAVCIKGMIRSERWRAA